MQTTWSSQTRPCKTFPKGARPPRTDPTPEVRVSGVTNTMPPRKKAPPSETLFTSEDIKEMIQSVAAIKCSMESIQKMTEENHRTLRGHNGTEGYITKI